MQTRLAITEEQLGELVAALNIAEESAAVITAIPVPAAVPHEPPHSDPRGDPPDRAAEDPAFTLLVRSITWISSSAYLERGAMGISIASAGWVPAFRAATATAAVPVFVHTHPGGEARFSSHDDLVDEELASAARTFGAPAYASIVIAGRPDSAAVTARFCILKADSLPPIHGETQGPSALVSISRFHTVDAVRVAGRSLQLLLPPDEGPAKTVNADDGPGPATDEVFDRQVRMLGTGGQRTLGVLNAAVVGAGGTGSALAVQLARLGVGTICLIDDDVVTPPTPTRGHGIRTRDVGRPKVEVLGHHLLDIGLGTRITAINAPLHTPAALQAIQHADVVFSCVDGHGARLILNRYAYAHVAVVIDLAVLVATAATTDGGIEIDERVTWIGPGAACLLCRGRLDAALAYAENLDPDTRQRLAGEGYVAAAETPQPAVVTLTTLVAALAATEFLLRLAGIGAPDATELLLRPHLGELRRNRIPQRPGCFCSDPYYIGRGQKSPYLDLMWPTPPLIGT